MIYMHVHVHVKPEWVDAFRAATIANATASRQEPGCLRFEFFQQMEESTRFVFVEAWKDPQAHAFHRDTLHYIKWRDEVNPMMATPRFATKFTGVDPVGFL